MPQVEMLDQDNSPYFPQEWEQKILDRLQSIKAFTENFCKTHSIATDHTEIKNFAWLVVKGYETHTIAFKGKTKSQRTEFQKVIAWTFYWGWRYPLQALQGKDGIKLHFDLLLHLAYALHLGLYSTPEKNRNHLINLKIIYRTHEFQSGLLSCLSEKDRHKGLLALQPNSHNHKQQMEADITKSSDRLVSFFQNTFVAYCLYELKIDPKHLSEYISGEKPLPDID